jgi:hypothetical protein
VKCARCGTEKSDRPAGKCAWLKCVYTDGKTEEICYECHMAALEASINSSDETMYETWKQRQSTPRG